MLRLRTTATLSALALMAGVAGTQWLSDQTGGGAAPSMRQRVALPAVHRARAVSAPVSRHYAHPAAKADPRSAMVAWVPISMPMASLPFAQMRDHDAGSLVLHLVIDGRGDVAQATLAQSSGDAVLDGNALAIARRWRFAVPADRPQGFSGDLPLSFDSGVTQFAQW